MPTKAVAFSSKYISSKCDACQNPKQEIVQTQDYIGIGKFRIFGVGSRNLQLQCDNCGRLSNMNDPQRQKAKKIKYYDDKDNNHDTVLSSKGGGRKKYPILEEERRGEIRSSNLKEGMVSMIIGVIIGIIIIPLPFGNWTTVVGLIIILYSILGGLYAALEDPERKHRDLLNNKKSLL